MAETASYRAGRAIEGDVFPIRARYAGTTSPYGIGVNEWGEQPGVGLWYSLPDVLGSYLRTGRVPRIRRVIRFEPVSGAEGLREVMFRSAVSLYPKTGIFGPMIDERRRVERDPRLPQGEGKRVSDALKIVANAASYGVFARMDRKEEKTPLLVHGLRSFSPKQSFSPEDPGPLCFPPTAALITGAARLILMMLEVLVERAGGRTRPVTPTPCSSYPPRRVKSLRARVAPTLRAGAQAGVRAIPWSKLDDIIGAFDSLNVYERQNVPHLLKIEDVNFVNGRPGAERRQLWFFGPSAKRYCLYVQSSAGSIPVEFADPAEWIGGEVDDESDFDFDIAKPSDHGLGHLLNPIDPESEDRHWKRQAWDWMLRVELGAQPSDLPFLDLPAVSRTSISTPGAMAPFERRSKEDAYEERVKPFNFLLTCFPHPDYKPPGKRPQFRLVAPYDKYPEHWIDLPWYDANTGERFSISTAGEGGAGVVRVMTYREILQTHLVHEEAKSLSPDGQPCRRDTRGLLRRRRVQMLGNPAHIGKEGNLLEERVRGEIVEEQDYLDEYDDPEWSDFETIVKPAMLLLSSGRLSEASGLDRTTVKRIRSGRSVGTRDSRRRLFEATLLLAREELRRQGITPPRDPLVCLVVFRQQGMDAVGADHGTGEPAK